MLFRTSGTRICALCNKWLFNIFDSIISLYGADHYGIDAFSYR